ncbi:hypothetical protein MMC06_001823 [Schaereria dolodes]|nr:hypothetical protein [Schaereria dolodes]
MRTGGVAVGRTRWMHLNVGCLIFEDFDELADQSSDGGTEKKMDPIDSVVERLRRDEVQTIDPHALQAVPEILELRLVHNPDEPRVNLLVQ